MGKYIVEYTDTALKDLKKHKNHGNKSTLKKIENLIEELELHPFSGTEKPEELKYSLNGFWSRRINRVDRLVYSVDDKTITVEIVSAMGHYSL